MKTDQLDERYNKERRARGYPSSSLNRRQSPTTVDIQENSS